LFRPIQAEWRNTAITKDAIASFGANKAAGPDGFKPTALHALPDTCLDKLVLIYDAIMTAGYTPLIWRSARVVYIPKVGKTAYALAKSYRPISLTPFLFKGLERLVHWHLQETTLTAKPYNKNQHAFRLGRSTETALSQTVNIIEKGVLRNGFTLGVFLDVEGAFDNLSYAAAKKALTKKGVKTEIKTWYLQYLKNRTSIIELKGITRRIEIENGCPQGGILSVVLWNMAFDGLLAYFKTGRVRCVGFADDGVLLIHGKDLPQMYKLMQVAIDKANKWAGDNGLKLSPAKTIAILFTHKLKYTLPHTKLKMNGRSIELSPTAKYLGITLDQALNWNEHIKQKCKQVKGYIHMTAGSLGKVWGPTPELMHWIWTSVARPALTYGSFVWGGNLNKTQLDQLESTQRAALTLTGHVRRSTPGSGLNIVTNTLPIDLFLQEHITKTRLRLKPYLIRDWAGKGPGRFGKLGHIALSDAMLELINLPDNNLDSHPTSKT
jgi:hypothetical protein